jgi:vacuolar-type H+-ATPase subunit H
MTTADATRAEASHVTDTATEQARTVAHEAKDHVRSTANQMHDDLKSRANEEASKFAQTLHDAGSQMRQMADAAGGDEPSFASSMVREGAQAAERFASKLDEGGVDRMMADVRSWARRNPGGFLLGAAVAGFVAGRVARNLSGNDNTSYAATNSAGYPSAMGPSGYGALE